MSNEKRKVRIQDLEDLWDKLPIKSGNEEIEVTPVLFRYMPPPDLSTRNEHSRSASFPFFSASDLKKATKLTWFEKICLWFVKPQYRVDKAEGHTMKYKIFRGRMYIIDHWINPPQGWYCRC